MTSETILGIFLIAAVVVPVWILVRASGKSGRILRKELINLNKILPAAHDIWSKRVLAVTPDNFLTFIHLHSHTRERIDLKAAHHSYVLVNDKTEMSARVDSKTTDTLDLVIECSGRSIRMNLYDYTIDDPVLCGEHVVMAKKWRDIIRERISHHDPKRVSA